MKYYKHIILCAAILFSISYIAASDNITAAPSLDYKYLLKSENGTVSLFSNSGELLETYDIYVNYLPKTDTASLEKGIIINSDEELLQLIEDFDG